MATATRVVLAQLPFPSTASAHPSLTAFYERYGERYRALLPSYFVPQGELWELPLWVAYLAGLLKYLRVDAEWIDLSKYPASSQECAPALLMATKPGDVVFLSPLAQNFDLAISLSRVLQRDGRFTVLGGNMATLAQPGDASHVHAGQVTPEVLSGILRAPSGSLTTTPVVLGRRHRVPWSPDYRIFGPAPPKVPLLRLNASHGCLYACDFCGDAWSQQLHVVERQALEDELRAFEELFPTTTTIYVGDKTFGQSREAVTNLAAVLRDRRYDLIVQTHVMQVDERLVGDMVDLNVRVVEMGFETADDDLLRASNKSTRGLDHYLETLAALADAGIRVVLNVLGSLPRERAESHEATIRFIRDTDPSLVWLYNLYNFVPYPLTPIFSELRSRIFNWTYADWREDARVVFHPFFQSAEEAWERFLEKIDAATAVLDRTEVASR